MQQIIPLLAIPKGKKQLESSVPFGYDNLGLNSEFFWVYILYYDDINGFSSKQANIISFGISSKLSLLVPIDSNRC